MVYKFLHNTFNFQYCQGKGKLGSGGGSHAVLFMVQFGPPGAILFEYLLLLLLIITGWKEEVYM